MLLNFLELRIAIALIGTGLAAWEDARTSFIDDRITFAMIGAGLLLDVLLFDYEFYASMGIIALIIAVLGFIAYKTGQFGGGDVLLLLGIHLLLPINPQAQYAIYPFVLSVLVASTFFASAGSAVWYAKRLWEEKKLVGRKTQFIAVVLAAASILVFTAPLLNLKTKLVLAAITTSTIFLMAFRNELNQVIIKRISIKEVEDEDILALEEMPAELVKKYSLGKVLTKSEVEKLSEIEKKEGVRRFPVYKELPRFGPYLLAGLIASLLVGDLVAFVFFK